MGELLKKLYKSINDQNIKNRTDSKYWIYSSQNIIVKEENINKRYIKVLFFNREFNEENNLMRLYLKVNGNEVLQEEFTVVSEYNNANIMGFILPIDLAEDGNDIIINGYVIDGNKIELSGLFIQELPEIKDNERVLAYKEYVCNNDIDLIALPVLKEEYWMCSCGYINNNTSAPCQNCHQTKENIDKLLKFDYQETVLSHLMDRIDISLDETIDEIVQKYCQAIQQKYYIDENISKQRIDVSLLENKQKELLKEKIYQYINTHQLIKHLKDTFQESVESYVKEIATRIIGVDEIIQYLNMEKLEEEYKTLKANKDIQTKKNKTRIRKQLIIASLVLFTVIGIIFGYKMLFRKSETINDVNYGNIIDGRELIPAKDSASGLWGYIDKDGDVKIPFKYVNAYNFENKKAIVETKEGTYDFIDGKGESLFHGEFSDLRFNERTSINLTADEKKYIITNYEEHSVKFIDLDTGVTKEYKNTDRISSWPSKYYFLLNTKEVRTSEEDGKSFVVDINGAILYDYSTNPKLLFGDVSIGDPRYFIAESGNGNYIIIDSVKNKEFKIEGNYDRLNPVFLQSKKYSYNDNVGITNIPYEDLLFCAFKNDKCYIIDIYGDIRTELDNPSFDYIIIYNRDYETYIARKKQGEEYFLDKNLDIFIKGNDKTEFFITDNGMFVSVGQADNYSYYQIEDGKKIVITEERWDSEWIDQCYKNGNQNGKYCMHSLDSRVIGSGSPSQWYNFLWNKEISLEKGFNLFYDNHDYELVSSNATEMYLSNSVLYNADTNQKYNINGFICGKLSKAVIFAEPSTVTSQDYEYLKQNFGYRTEKKYRQGLIDANGKIVLEAKYTFIYEFNDYILCCNDKNSYLLDKETYEVVKTYNGFLLYNGFL